MTNKTYRTAHGKVIDIDALQSANENVAAIGNMNVNARGDEIGPNGTVVKSRNQVMKEYYDVKDKAVVSPGQDFDSKIVAERERARMQREQANRNKK